MSQLPNIIDYFRDCYQADFRAVHLLNFFGNKVTNAHFLPSSELLSGSLVQFPAPSEWAENMVKKLALYGKEKTLYCGAFFLSGETSVFGKTTEVFAPLFIYPIEIIQEEEVYYFVLNVDDTVINPAFVDSLKSEIEDSTGIYEQLVRDLPKGFIRFDESHFLEKTLSKYFPKLDLSRLSNYPNILNEGQIKTLRKSKKEQNEFAVLPAIGVGMVNKAMGARGILNELEAIGSQNHKSSFYSNPLRAIFENFSERSKSPKSKFLAPVTLSQAQENIIHSAETNTLTLAVGPPGTGKSFTIAALAVDFLVQKKSVLIAARNNQAVNVVADKIESDFGLKDVVVRAGRQDYQKFLKKRLDNLLHGIGVETVKKSAVNAENNIVKKFLSNISNLENKILKREKEEMNRGLFLKEYQDTFFQNLKRKWVDWRIKKEIPFWQLLFQYEREIESRNKYVKRFIQKTFQSNLSYVLKKYRNELQHFLKAIRKRQGSQREQFFEDIVFDKVFTAFPIWVVNTADINRVLPLYKDLFDLVIIDEASQCDVPSALPILQRGKKAVIVGDPKQLRHLSFLPKLQQQNLVQKHNLQNLDFELLNYRNNSLLDIVSESINSQEQVHFLDEHYRSMPEIIAFSNQQFYDSNLKIMTTNPTNQSDKAVFIHQIEGKRYKRGYNKNEALAILEMVQKIIEGESEFEPTLSQSLGILSPFREQVNHIQNLFQKEISLEAIQKHRILIGTPHAFQGEERDLMLISFAIDDDSHPSTFQYLNREDVFNVSITRARSKQHLFLSADISKLNSQYLFTKYLKSISENQITSTQKKSNKEHDDFINEVAEILWEFGLENIHKDYHIAGLEIDLVTIHKGQTYCIDLVGYPGDFMEAIPLHKWKMLSRVGLNVLVLPYSYWILEREMCEKRLKWFLKIDK